MAADSLHATLSFLTDAAHLLVSASPETSAHLMTRRNLLMLNNNLGQSDVQRQRACGCCGHIMIAGRGDVLKMDSGKTCGNKRRKKRANNTSPRIGCRKTLTCGKCGRYTTINFLPPACVPRRRSKQSSKTALLGGAAHATSSSTTTTTPTARASKSASTPMVVASSGESTRVSANASSKKRAKNRKQGLQALLQQSSTSMSQSGLGLSLADFMQN